MTRKAEKGNTEQSGSGNSGQSTGMPAETEVRFHREQRGQMQI